MKFGFALLVFFCVLTTTNAQQRTIGLKFKDNQSHTGYVLLAPINNTETFLIDACGRLVHNWQSNYKPAFSAHLLPNGDLLRTIRLDISEIHGGSGGGVEIISWDGELKWRFVYSDSTVSTHHDAIMLPNGNVLILAAESIPLDSAVKKGRNPTLLFNDLWSDVLIEVKPTGKQTGEIVWEWHAWDHLIQERDSTKPTYGVLSDHPGRIDLNYISNAQVTMYRDWTHINSMDYDEDLDQIALSVRSFDEVWVIDHSTTKAESRSSVGGRAGHGGEILYRWGNPETYGRGILSDKKLFAQHNASWVHESGSTRKKILIYNNGANRLAEKFSTIDEIELPEMTSSTYYLEPGKPYGPQTPSWSYQASRPIDLYSAVFSGAERLPNGNTLICEGVSGAVTEVDRSGTTHWEYVNPVGNNGPLPQGTLPPDIMLFRAPYYPLNYPAFVGKVIIPGLPLERNPIQYECTIDTIQTDVSEDITDGAVLISPNPCVDQVHITSGGTGERFVITDLTGREYALGTLSVLQQIVDVSKFPTGVYIFRTEHGMAVKLFKL